MPTVLLRDGYRFMIYTNDHEPMHVHVVLHGVKAIIEFDPVVRVRRNGGMTPREIRRAFATVRAKRELFIERWREIYGTR